MANVFLSYKKEDAASAERIAAALRNQGLSVWWDDQLTPHQSWDAMIQKEIEAAAAVVVLWTTRSVASEWVRTEAHFAAEHSKLVPVRLDDCPIPIAFLLRQTVNLAGWNGDPQQRQWRKLLTWIMDLVSMHGAGGVQMQPGVAPANRFHEVLGHLPSGEAIVDGAFVNFATPAGTVFRDAEGLPVMRVLPKGSFMLGSPPGDADRTAAEGPQRRVTIPETFAMSVYPVLVEEYRQVVGQLPAADLPAGPPRGLRKFFGSAPKVSATAEHFTDGAPMTRISFGEAARFTAMLTEATGEKYRVPSETEWEYACRAGTQTRYAFGDFIDTSMAAFGAASGPLPPGKFKPNGFGLFDLHGNVREWTADLWHESYDATPLDGSPASEGHSSMRVVRGGAWSDAAVLLRSSARMRATESGRSNLIGIRVARTIGQ